MKKSNPNKPAESISDDSTERSGETLHKSRFSCPKCGAAQSFWRIECSPFAVRCPSCNMKLRIRLPKFRYFTWVLIAILLVLLLISYQIEPKYSLAVLVLYLPLMFVIDLLVSLKWGHVEKDE